MHTHCFGSKCLDFLMILSQSWNHGSKALLEYLGIAHKYIYVRMRQLYKTK